MEERERKIRAREGPEVVHSSSGCDLQRVKFVHG